MKEQLKQAREKSGMTQAEVGKILGVGRASICKTEGNPGSASFGKILSYLSAIGYELQLKKRGSRKP